MMNSQAKKKFFSGLFGWWPTSLLCLFVLPMSAWAQVTFEQKSNPAGLFTSTSATKNLNEVVSTMTPSLSTGGYSFTHWTVNGVRENAPDGQAKNMVSVTLTENTVAIAHYRLDTNDSDSDGVPDWYEVRMFGNLDRNASYDGDGDGLSLADERKYGLAATIADEFMEGGASIRRSGQVFANFGGAKKLSVSSDPAGLLTSSETFPETNSSYTSPNKNGLTSGYYFSHWEVNGVRQADTSGIGLSQISFTMTEDKTVVAKYYAENADTDSDGLPDWYEWREFGNLDNNGTSDPDGDGFSMDAERQFGLSAVIGDEIMEGGASIRRSGQVFANFGGAKKLSVSSDPAGLLTSSETFPETNSSYTSPNKNGLTSGYYFSHWEVNGVRQADTSGIGLSQISFTMTEDKTVVAKYYAENADTDSDGLPDWYEWREFGNLDNNGTSDPDGDGFSMDAERQFGLSAVIGDEIMEGGGSIRRSGTFGYIEFQPNEDDDGDGLNKAQELHYGTSDDNADSDGDGFPDGAEVAYGSSPTDANSIANGAPVDLNLSNNFSFVENLPIGSIIGDFNGSDPDGDQMTYFLISGLGDGNNSLFSLETNGSLKTATTFDFETNSSNYSIRVQAKDSYNQIYDANFTLTLLDDIQEDTDKDGYPDFIELEQGTDFEDNSSFPGTDYRNADLSNFNAYKLNFNLGNFSNVNLEAKRMRLSSFIGANFSNANLKGGDRSGANFSNANFEGADLTGADLQDSNLSGANIHLATIKGAWFSSGTIWPSGFDYLNSGAWGPNVDFKNLDLSSFNAYRKIMDNANFSNVNLEDKRMRQSSFIGADFSNANLKGGDRSGANFSNANFEGADLTGADLQDSNLSGANIHLATIKGAWFSSGTIWPSGFDYLNSGAWGPNVDFKNLDLTSFDAYRKIMDNANFSNVNLEGKRMRLSSFMGANFSNANLKGGDRSGANFANANFEGADLTGADLQDSNLSGTNIQLATIKGAWFSSGTIWPSGFDYLNSGAWGPNVDFRNLDLSSFDPHTPGTLDLRHSNFEGVNLDGKRLRANFTGANFRNARLTGNTSDKAKFNNANFSGANLSGRNLSGASFTGAIYNESTIWPDGFDPVAAGAISSNNPKDLNSTKVLAFQENQPVDTIIGEFNATDPDGDEITYHFVNGENNNSLFTLDTNGTLKTATTFDFESNASTYTITVQAKDELNATTEGNFTVTLLDVYEDLDQDGTADHLDDDIDGDGFTNAEETTYGSDPRDANSVADTLPTALTLDNLKILENQPIGTVVGKFTVIDPDPDDVHRVVFNNLNENGSHNNFFTIDTNNTLRTAVLFDFENNSTNMKLRVKAKQGKIGVFWQYFTLSLINDPADDVVPPTDNNQFTPPSGEHNNSSDNNNTQPPFVNHNESSDDNNTQYPSYDANETVADTLPTALTLDNLKILENQPIGTVVGKFTVIDPDPGDVHRVVFNNLNENGSRNHLFTIDTNNTLRTAVLFDFENNSTNMILRVKAKQGQVGVFWQHFTLSLINDPVDDVVPPTDNNQSTPPSDEHNNSSDNNNTQPPFVDHNGSTDDNNTQYPSYDANETVADTLPTALTLDNLQILENQPIGTVVGKFTVIDPDPDDVHRVMFSQLDQNDSHNHLFIIDANNSLRTAVVFDFENNSSDLILRVKVRHGQVDVLRKSFTLSLINDPADDVVPPTDNNQSTPPSDEHNNSSDNNNTQPPFVDHNGSSDDNDTLPPLTDPDPDHEVNPYAWIPIIHTEHPQILEDGRIQLSGRVLYDGGGTMSEFGFLLSPTLRIPLNSPDTLKLEANGTADSFTLIIPESPYPRRLYVQAYSTNEAGMGLGQRRRLKIPEPLAKWWGEAMQGEGGWLQSPWFGAFKYYEQGWLYHAELGWLYSSPAEDGVWLWGSDNQWLWTKDGIYPYHYRWDDAAWGIWQKTTNGRIRTYNYGTGNYEN